MLESGPVALLQLAAPDLLINLLTVNGADVHAVIVAVGGLLQICIEPVAGVVVGPGDHVLAAQEVILVGMTVQSAVHDDAGLCAGDVLVGTEGAVLKAHDQAHAVGSLHVGSEPAVGGNIGEVALILLLGSLEEVHGHLGELGTGDLAIGTEGAVRIAVDDAHVAQGGDGVVAPQLLVDIGVVVGLIITTLLPFIATL